MPTPVALLTVANPKGDLVGLGEELESIRASLEGTGLEVQQRPYASLDTLLKALQDYQDRVAIFHYAGHANELGLLLETGPNGALAQAGGLAKFLSSQDSLKLLFLNGCSTANQIKLFHDAGIQAVIGTKEPIPDAGATQIASWFYRGLVKGASIAQAFAQAQAALEALPPDQTRDFLPSSDFLPSRDFLPSSDFLPSQASGDQKPSELWLLSAQSDAAKQWSLADALNDPLFGLPRLPQRDLPVKPYKHLSYFKEDEAELFFGRSREIRDLYFRVTTPSTDPILLLYGQSGVGKSSLLDAGLTPRLRAAGYEVRYVRRDAELKLSGTLAKALGVSDKDDLAAAWKHLEATQGKPVVILLDQLEEAHTRSKNEREAGRELEALSRGIGAIFASGSNRPKGKLVLSFRKEWVAEIQKALRPNQGFCSDLPLLMPLNEDGIKEAILGPTQTQRLQDKYRLSIAEDLPRAMAARLLDRNSPIAPTLQLTLTKMWDQASQNPVVAPTFNQSLYEKFENKGLAEYLDDQLKELGAAKPGETESGLALDLLHFHTTPQGTAEQHDQATLRKQYGQGRFAQIEELVSEAKRKYLLTDPAGDELKGTRLSHDTLAPYVRERFERSQLPGQRASRILENRVVDWLGGKTGTPLDERDLELVKQGEPGMRVLDGNEQRLVRASQQALEQRRLEEQKQAGKLQRLANNRAIWRRVAAGLVLVILGTGYLLLNQQNEFKRSQIAKYTFGNSIVQERDFVLKALILLKRSETLRSPDSQAQFRQFVEQTFLTKPVVFQAPPPIPPSNSNSVDGLALNPVLPHLASANRGSQVLVWNLQTKKQIALEASQGSNLLGREADRVAYSLDGMVLAAGGWNGTIAVWRFSPEASIYKLLCATKGPELGQPSEFVTAIALNKEGTRIVTGHASAKVKVWGYSQGECKTEPIAEAPKEINNRILAVKLSNDQQEVYAVSQGGMVWCSSNSEQNIYSLDAKEAQISNVVFHATEDRFAVGQNGGQFLADKIEGRCNWSLEPVIKEVTTGFAFGMTIATNAFVESGLLRINDGTQTYFARQKEPPRSLVLKEVVGPERFLIVAVGDANGRIEVRSSGIKLLDNQASLRKEYCELTDQDDRQVADQQLDEGTTCP